MLPDADAMQTTFLAVHRLAASHRGHRLLRDVSLTLREGEFVGIVGPNGAGKSSFLMTLLGMRTITGGTAMVLGQDLAALSASGWSALRRRIGYLPQREKVDPYFPVTAGEVVLMGRAGHGGTGRPYRREDFAKADACLAALGLDDLQNRPFGQLSGGEQQKTHLARILAQEPSLILLDEPMSGLDLKWQQRLGEIIENLAREHRVGVILVTHETQHLPPSCERLVLLREGAVFADGPRETVLDDSILSHLYDCPVRTLRESGRTYLSPWGR